MKRLVLTTFVSALCAVSSLAMPTQAELKKAQPLVAELMAPAMADFKAAGNKDKAAAAVKVADKSVEFANSAETEAAKFLLLKGAVNFYSRGESYDKAADTVTALQANVKDVTPAVIAEITGKATGKISETKAPRLFAQYRAAKLQVRAETEAKTIAQKLRKVKSDALRRRYAEALAVSGNWKAAYAEYAKLSDAKLKAVVDAEAKGQPKNAESGEFWWAYKPDFEDAEDLFKAHAAAFYRNALDAGEITGLKKNIVEQRIAGIVVAAAPSVAKEAEKTVFQATQPTSFKIAKNSPFTVKGDEVILTFANGEKVCFVQCPAGEFPMIGVGGSIVTAKITRPFWISKTPMTGKIVSNIWEGEGAERVKSQKYFRRTAKKVLDVVGKINLMYGSLGPQGYVIRPASVAELQYAFCANDKHIGSHYNLGLLKNEDKGKVFIGNSNASASTRPNVWGLYDFVGYEIVADSVDLGSVEDWEDREKGKFRSLPRLGNYDDPFYWSSDEIPTEYMMYRSAWCTSVGAEGTVHLVVGPDLVSEWKAKHGKK